MAFEGEHTGFVQSEAKAVLEQMGIKLFRAQVAGIYADKTVNIKRLENLNSEGVAVPDGAPAVRLDYAHRLSPGDFIWCMQHQGHAFVLGKHGDKYEYIEDLRSDLNSATKSASDAHSRIDTLVARIDNINSKIDGTNSRIDSSNSYISNNSTKIDNVSGRVGNLSAVVDRNTIFRNGHSHSSFSRKGHDNADHRVSYTPYSLYLKHNHDGRYAYWSHNHDYRYYTEGQSDYRYAYKGHFH